MSQNPQDPNETQPETHEAPEQPPVQAPPVDPEVARLQQRVADLEAKTRELEEQTRHYAAAYDRARSEFAAAKERIQRENDRTQKRDQVKLVTGMLGVLDSLDRSLESVRGQAPSQAFVDGVQLIRSQLESALAGLGMKRFDGVGEAFDPSRHQAVTMMPVPDQAQDNQVIHGVAAGVVVGEEVVRPASVVVGKFSGDAAVH